MNKTKTCVLTLLLALGLAISAIPIVIPKTQAISSASDQTFSIMQISDTQHLALLSPTLYNDTTSWIINNSAAYNLQMVVHTGDMTDGLNITSTSPLTYVVYNASLQAQEWAVANASMGKLLDTGIPYCWCAGNHDQDPHGSNSGTMRMGSSYLAFNATAMRSRPYWVSDIYDSKNTAVKFTYGGYSFLIINLEFTGNTSARAWMTRLLDENPSANVIVATHSYLSVSADYSAVLPAITAWQKALKATLDSYPNVFLVLCGHVYSATTSANMTRVGGRQEILFDRQEENNGTGAAAVRIYTFNLTSKKVSTTTYAVDKQTWLTDAYNQFSFDASITSDWTLVNDGRALKAYPDLREYVWQKDARMPPNGQYDKIGLHRLVKTGTTPKGVVFICPEASSSGEEYISNPPTDNLTKLESQSQAIYWANRGFDVYAIDFRWHFIPNSLNASQLSFMAEWSRNTWMSDIKEAIDKVKEVSGAQKVFIVGYSSGSDSAVNYASKYWKEDIKGIILLSPWTTGLRTIVAKRGNETNTYNLTEKINTMISTGSWASENLPLWLTRTLTYALENPGDPAVNATTGQPLLPPINPTTGKAWANVTEWVAYAFSTLLRFTNVYGGYGNLTLVMQHYTYKPIGERWVPARFGLEDTAMMDWVNCPYLSYDFDDHYREISMPLLAFVGGFSQNSTGTFQFVNGINNTDFTGVMLQNYGHYDIFFGPYSTRDVSEPAYQWMLSHLASLDVTAYCSVTVMPGWTWWFFAHNQGGVAPFAYQWYEGLSPLQGQTSMVLPVTKSTPGVYSFYCRVTDSAGTTTTSNAVTLTVRG